MPQIIDASAVPGLLAAGMTVYIQGSTGEPQGLMEALRLVPEASDGVHYLGCFLPGVNANDPAAIHPGARLTGFFVHGPFARTYGEGRMRFLPLHYSQTFDYLAALPPVDIAMIQVSPPDGDGFCNLGICVDKGKRKALCQAPANAAFPSTHKTDQNNVAVEVVRKI